MLDRVTRSILSVFFVLIMFAVGNICALQAHAGTPTNTLLQLSANTVTSGTAVALTASVTANGIAVSPGQVTFCDATATYCEDKAVLGTAQLTANGSASVRLTLGIGMHSIKAIFAATKTDAGSLSAAQSLIVTGKHPTATAISTSGSPGSYTLTAAIVGYGDSDAGPGGIVSFLAASNGNTQLGAAPIGSSVLAQSFAIRTPNATGFNPAFIAVADFNGDGKPDMAVLNSDAGTVSILPGKGDGTFQKQVIYTVGKVPISVVAGDFNGDGIPDLTVANSLTNTVSVLLGNGDGTFQNQVTYPTGATPDFVATGDFNQDGNLDLVITDSGGSAVSVLLGNGDGTFQNQKTYSVGAVPDSVAVGDLNADGNLDLVVANKSSGTLSVLMGNDDGTFQNQKTYAAGSYPESVTIGDFNGDGIPDLTVANYLDNTISVLPGNGDGTFRNQKTYATGVNPTSVATGDFNGDGKLDLAVASFDYKNANVISVLPGNGDGTFQSPVTYAIGHGPAFVATGDFNGDGIPDLAVASGYDDTVTLLLNQVTQTATATLSGLSIPGTGTHTVDARYAGDANYGTSISGTVSLSNQTTETTLAASANPVVSGTPATLIATVSANGAPISSGQVNFCDATAASCVGSAILGTAQLASSGTASIQLILTGIGAHSVRAVFPGTPTEGSSTSATVTITVIPAPPGGVKLQVIAFGDSLLDAGTYQQFAKANFDGGEFTTNPSRLFVQDVASIYGDVLLPAFQGGFGRPLAASGGFDYAEGGSRVSLQPGVGHDTSGAPNAAYSEETTLPVTQQLATYLSTYERFHPNQLVIINGGANDIFFNLAAAEQAGTPAALQAAEQAIVQSAIDLAGAVDTVVAKGATHVALMNMPDLGTTPQGLASADHGQSLTQISQLFNETLIAQLQSRNLTSKVILLDIYSIVDNVVANFQNFGFKVSNTGTACNAQAEIAEATALKLANPSQFSDSLFCSPATYTTPTAPEDFVFADTVHPSTHLSAIVATAVEQQLASSALMQ
jgi:phospholipase/lecithinase/hemolysin